MNYKQRQVENLIRRIIKEDEESFNLEKTVMDTAQFKEEEIPNECIDDPSKPRIENIQACITKITEKSTALNNAIKALSDSLNKAKTEASSIPESRRDRKRF